jgi:hypothetical protein
VKKWDHCAPFERPCQIEIERWLRYDDSKSLVKSRKLSKDDEGDVIQNHDTRPQTLKFHVSKRNPWLNIILTLS